MIGRNMPGIRAAAIVKAVDALTARSDVDKRQISGVAHEVPGVWLLLAAVADQRLSLITLHRTPHSLRAALDTPVHQNLHDAVIPGFALKWDLADLVAAVSPRKVRWLDPTDWNRNLVRVQGPYEYTASDNNQVEQ